MSNSIIKYYEEKGTSIELIDEFNYYHLKTPYSHYISKIGAKILCIQVIGEAYKSSYKSAFLAIDKVIREATNDGHKIILIHNYEELRFATLHIRKHYASWLLKNLDAFENVIFYKPNPIISFYINTKKFLEKDMEKVKLFQNLDSLTSFLEHKNENIKPDKYRNLNRNNILSILNSRSIIKNQQWSGNIDNGRVIHEALLVDGNIIIRHIKGSMVAGDISFIRKTNTQIAEYIKPELKPYISLIDLDGLKSISVTGRRESAVFIEELAKEMKAVIFFNTSNFIRLSIKLTSAIKPLFREKIHIAKDLESALILALQLKGVKISDSISPPEYDYPSFSLFDRIFNKQKIECLLSLQNQIEALKKDEAQHIENIFSMLSRITWDENFVPISEKEIDKKSNFADLYYAISLLHKDIKELYLNSKQDS